MIPTSWSGSRSHGARSGRWRASTSGKWRRQRRRSRAWDGSRTDHDPIPARPRCVAMCRSLLLPTRWPSSPTASRGRVGPTLLRLRRVLPRRPGLCTPPAARGVAPPRRPRPGIVGRPGACGPGARGDRDRRVRPGAEVSDGAELNHAIARSPVTRSSLLRRTVDRKEPLGPAGRATAAATRAGDAGAQPAGGWPPTNRIITHRPLTRPRRLRCTDQTSRPSRSRSR